MKRYLPVTLLACFLVLTSLVCGCCMCWGWPAKAHFERTEQLSASMAVLERIKIDTSFGSVKTELPITVKGDFGKTRFYGSIGQGKGKIDLKTSFGSIKIK